MPDKIIRLQLNSYEKKKENLSKRKQNKSLYNLASVMSWLKVLNPTNYEVFYVSKGPNYKEDSSLALVFC